MAGHTQDPATSVIVSGVCTVMFAYDIGFATDLDQVERLMTAGASREALPLKRRSPRYFAYKPAPVRIVRESEPISIAGRPIPGPAECIVYDFGGVSISYTIPIAGPLADLIGLSEGLYENSSLLADSRHVTLGILEAIRPAVVKPGLVDLVEDYAIYRIREWAPEPEAARIIDSHAQTIARILRSDRAELSAEEVADCLACRLSYTPTDAAIVDWNAAMLFLPDDDDVADVLEFANVELLEMRLLDDRLDAVLDRAYRATSHGALRYVAPGKELARIARLQVDSALLFEGVNNALKLLGDQYLARLYRRAAQRFHLPEWDANILRKLHTAEAIYQKLSDRRTNRRMEVLEIIIILLIAFEIGMALYW